ncbi:uncharacterized protein LOC117113266 isoform X1 [Anneissia japonica]|uniref:uncharacterized protein LOC117113266 isoform X1 n=1 Tax=Anneissia japonica TaxID=1529436 RepID=UPI0014257B30|nr:uncharacterized protein LOC117113266 isoform X1 [Anneissia japonica]XP_033112456.1 uncharacterized protein LOC117113266 isoform X2 [Anneissia japonica]XP_033112457.1 uncharacterized protein LOC117113266 isoform X1 [Anneissia japonica]
MYNPLVPDIPAGQSSNIAEDEMEKEPSCCSPTRSKLKTSPIKVFSLIHILCGALAIGLGIVACVFGCMYPGAGIVAGVAFFATGVVGMYVMKHGVLAAVYGFLSAFSFLLSIALTALMLTALPESEGSYHEVCSNYECSGNRNNCCYDSILSMSWENVAVDMAILVVAVVELVASLLATTLSLRNTNWITICCLKKNMDEQQAVSNSVQRTSVHSTDESSPLSGQSPAMKRCWKPCESKSHRNLTITLSVIDIVIGVICVAIGIFAVYVGTKYAHIGIPIWSGLMIFAVTGIFGLLSVTKKGSYIPCFFSLSILAFLMSINMFTWGSSNIWNGYDDYIYGCIDWSCKTTPIPYTPYYPYYPYYTEYPYCSHCVPGCCQNGYSIRNTDKTEKFLLDLLTVGFGVLETLICIVTIGLSFSQLSCYLCCRGLNCNCCQPETIDQYQMVMTPNGNMMMLAVPKAHGMPTMVQNQPVMVQHQPVVIPNQHIAAQNQQVGIQTPPVIGIGERSGPEEQLHSAQQPVTIHTQGHAPMLAQSPGQLMMVGGQGQPYQGRPMMLQAQRQPIMLQAQGQSMIVQGQEQPMILPAQGQPMIVQGHGQPMMVHQGQGQPMFQQPMFVQGVGQVGMFQGQGQPTNQTVMITGQGQPLHTVTQAQMPRPEQQIPATGEPADTGEAMALVAGQDAGSILNPTV